MTAALLLFQRLIVRPMKREPVRTALTVFAVALGVAVVVAIDLAGDAATGSFRSSLETLVGNAEYEISAVGGVDEKLLGELVTLPFPLEFAPRIEGFAVVDSTHESVALLGLDLIGDESLERDVFAEKAGVSELTLDNAVWVGPGIADKAGGTIGLTINARSREYKVAGILESRLEDSGSRDKLVVMDIAVAQAAMSKAGRLDRIEVRTPSGQDGGDWEAVLRPHLPEGVSIARQGARTDENRKMLSAFRWNLRVLSYISLVVGAFLIYNTISISVVRRRVEIGILRALGATAAGVQAGFLAEAAFFGLAGSASGLLLGRVMAEGAVEMMAATVRALYVSSAPGEIAITGGTVLIALVAGVGVAVWSAWGPAREAARIPAAEAMARGRQEFLSRMRVGRDLAFGATFALAALAASQAPSIDGKPLFGYLAALLLIAAAAFATPAAVTWLTGFLSGLLLRLLGVTGLLASRSLLASLGRTSVLVGALSTAVAMMASVGIMVGSFRDTVALWMENQLRADYYIRPAGSTGVDRHPTMDAAIADRIEALPGVLAVDRFRSYEISYEGRPATFGAGQIEVVAKLGRLRFLDGREASEVLPTLKGTDRVVISEPFSSKHGLRRGDTIRLPLGGREVAFEIAGVYYDYSNERGFVIADRDTLLKYLPDPSPSNLAVYLKPGVDRAEAGNRIREALGGAQVFMADNRRLRTQGLIVFDRTFAITYALEAVAIVVAIMGMAGALLALVIDRRREIGVLRFLGASKGQIRRLILCESGLIGLLSNAVGLALGSLLSLILIYVINKQSFGWTIQFHWPVLLLIGALTLIYAAAIVAGIYPARTAVRLNPIEVMHEE